ncbi:hypothetical protein QAD02_013738 [Eretmocerus hayati]|uniref:Uncharacterized protein n=1 Tax=Eretmocerus hayati TaxID=131215 RepID=A0ACC2P542_9HYME|nr:hypothetical protein QAD02_013738 [Eretmocerus hayati]
MNITDDNLNHMSEDLHQFVEEILPYYSLKALTYDVYQLLHVVESINWGLLWAHPAYGFDAANGKILAEIQSEKGLILQKISYLNLSRFQQIQGNQLYPEYTNIEIFLYTGISGARIQKAVKLNSMSHVGNGRPIRTFRVDFDSRLEFTECDILQVREKHLSDMILKIVSISKEEQLLSTDRIDLQCVFIESDTKDFIIPVANELYYQYCFVWGGVAHVTSMKVKELDCVLGALIEREVAEPQTASQQC